MRTSVGSKTWLKYMTRSAVMNADDTTLLPTPRLTGLDTSRPIPPGALGSNTGIVRRLLAAMLTLFTIGDWPSRLYVTSAVVGDELPLPRVRNSSKLGST